MAPVAISWVILRRAWALLGAALVVGISAAPARAVPAFAVQTGQTCETCHVGGFGPQLTPYGRNFKLNGYTQRSTPFNVPLAADQPAVSVIERGPKRV